MCNLGPNRHETAQGRGTPRRTRRLIALVKLRIRSVARSKALLDGLARGGPQATDIFECPLAREEAIVGSPLTTGNQVTRLQDGPATCRAMLLAIEAARDHIPCFPRPR